MTMQEFLDLWEEKTDRTPVPSGHQWRGRCPVHEADPMGEDMAAAEGDDRIVLNCFAECDPAAIVEALGITFNDLQFEQVDYAQPEAIYDYTDEWGNLLFQVVRFPGKRIRQRHLKDGEWVWNLDDVRRVLYNLPEVLEAVKQGRTIYVVEGEKDVEAWKRRGYVATCNPGGAGKWNRKEYAEFLRGAKVIIVADRDAVGRRHAYTVRDALQGVAEGIWVVQAKSGKDSYDHFEAGHEANEFQPVRERVRRGLITAKELAEQALEDLDLRPQDIPGYVPWEVMPQIVFRAGRVYPIGAYTGDGKTSGALQATRKFSMEGVKTGYFSLEMPERDLRNKLLQHRGIPLSVLEQPWGIRGSQYEPDFRAGVEEISNWQTDIIFNSSISSEEIEQLTIDREYDVIFVDHVHRFAWGRERRDLEAQVNRLTNLALEQNIVVVILCQIRKYQRGKDLFAYPKPTLQDITETSMIGNEASMALAIWRQRDDSGMQFTGLTEVVILKNRHTTGPHDRQGMIYVPHFDPARTMFTAEPPREEWGWDDEESYDPNGYGY